MEPTFSKLLHRMFCETVRCSEAVTDRQTRTDRQTDRQTDTEAPTNKTVTYDIDDLSKCKTERYVERLGSV